MAAVAAISDKWQNFLDSLGTSFPFRVATGDFLFGTKVNEIIARLTAIQNGTSGPTLGASTAAAGTTTADAGVLPSGAGVYPTTAADDTKGVRIVAADKVTQRMLLIGNNVSNKILKVYPPTGGTINGAAANAAFSTVSGKGAVLYCTDATANTWLAW